MSVEQTLDQDVQTDDFMKRRDAARQRLDALTGATSGDLEDRAQWFSTVYESANGDPAAVPWADLAPKQALVEWLAHHAGQGRRALDVACGLGDNAEALSAAGYETTAFDLAPEAIAWARRRFPQSAVTYTAADLLALPQDWQEAFELVHECYTIQALKSPLRQKALDAIARLVAPGGSLLLISRCIAETTQVSGPPWPLAPSEWRSLGEQGLELVEEDFYEVVRKDRTIPHVRAHFRRII